MVIETERLIGQTIETCTIEQLLGRGGMGAVYLAQQTRPRRRVAIKVLMPGLSIETQQNSDFLARFRREADAVAALDHVNILPLYEYGEKEELAYLVMPYVTGGTLRDRLTRRKILPLEETLTIIEQAASALDYAHERGIIHRDLKPANILFHADGRVLLADFGLAKVIRESTEAGHSMASNLTSAGTVIGTPEYFSPEQSTGKPVDKRTDVYSLGIVLFQMLAGRVPFIGSSPVVVAIKHTTQEPPLPSSLNSAIPPAVEHVIMKAIAKNPDERYSSAGEMARALNEAIHSHTQPDQFHLTQNNPLDYRTVPDNNQFLPLASDTPTEKNPPIAPLQKLPQPAQQDQSFPAPRHTQSRSRKTGQMVLLTVLLLLLLIVGGAVAYVSLQVSPKTTPLKTTIRPKATSTLAPQTSLPPALIPAGKLLYGTTTPGCNDQQNLWSSQPNASISCTTSSMELRNYARSHLAGVYLNMLPHHVAIPQNYIVQVQVHAAPESLGDFGVLYRSQPDPQGGAFGFMLFAPQLWKCTVYNSEGKGSTIASAPTSVVTSEELTIDIAVSGNEYTFYINGIKQGNAESPAYQQGNIALAADTQSHIIFKNFAVYALPNTQ